MKLMGLLATGALLGGLLVAAPVAEARHRHDSHCGHYDRYDRYDHHRGHDSYRYDNRYGYGGYGYEGYGYGGYGYGYGRSYPSYGYGYGYRYGRPYPAPYVGWHYHGRQRCHRSHGYDRHW